MKDEKPEPKPNKGWMMWQRASSSSQTARDREKTGRFRPGPGEQIEYYLAYCEKICWMPKAAPASHWTPGSELKQLGCLSHCAFCVVQILNDTARKAVPCLRVLYGSSKFLRLRLLGRILVRLNDDINAKLTFQKCATQEECGMESLRCV